MNYYTIFKSLFQSSIFNDSTILITFIFLKLITIEINEKIYVNINVKIYVLSEMVSINITFVLRMLNITLLCKMIPKIIPNKDAIIVNKIVSLYMYLKISIFLNPKTFIVDISFFLSFMFISNKLYVTTNERIAEKS